MRGVAMQALIAIIFICFKTEREFVLIFKSN